MGVEEESESEADEEIDEDFIPRTPTTGPAAMFAGFVVEVMGCVENDVANTGLTDRLIRQMGFASEFFRGSRKVTASAAAFEDDDSGGISADRESGDAGDTSLSRLLLDIKIDALFFLVLFGEEEDEDKAAADEVDEDDEVEDILPSLEKYDYYSTQQELGGGKRLESQASYSDARFFTFLFLPSGF